MLTRSAPMVFGSSVLHPPIRVPFDDPTAYRIVRYIFPKLPTDILSSYVPAPIRRNLAAFLQSNTSFSILPTFPNTAILQFPMRLLLLNVSIIDTFTVVIPLQLHLFGSTHLEVTSSTYFTLMSQCNFRAC